MDSLLTFGHAVWAIMLEMSFWLLVGAAAAGLLHVVIPGGFIRRHLGGRGAWTTVKAALIGVPMPLCSCAVIPTGLGLRKDGAGTGAALSFITATPQTGIDSVAVTAAFLGWPFAVFKLGAAFVTGVTAGLLGNAFAHQDPPPHEPPSDGPHQRRSPAAATREALHFSLDLVKMIWRWLAFGVLASAAIGLWLGDDALSFNGYGGDITAMLISLAIAVPLYVCATASVPIAAAMVAAGLPTGAALVFLMAGPATNIATLGAIGRALGIRAAIVYLGTVVVGSVALGLGYEAFIGLDTSSVEHAHMEHATWWAQLSAVLLTVLLLGFAAIDLRRLLSRKPATAAGCCGGTSPATNSCCDNEAKPATSCCGPATNPEPTSCCDSPQAVPKTSCCGDTPPSGEAAAETPAKSCCGDKPPAPRSCCDK